MSGGGWGWGGCVTVGWVEVRECGWGVEACMSLSVGMNFHHPCPFQHIHSKEDTQLGISVSPCWALCKHAVWSEFFTRIC